MTSTTAYDVLSTEFLDALDAEWHRRFMGTLALDWPEGEGRDDALLALIPQLAAYIVQAHEACLYDPPTSDEMIARLCDVIAAMVELDRED